MISLPIDPLLPKLLETLQEKKNVLLRASPGSGKTTRVPPALLKASFLGPNQEIWVLEPRRVAAKYSALRIAEELGEAIGERVGYLFRFENRTSSKTRLKFLTEGMFNRLILSDPLLKNVGIVVLDEFHERHLQSDFALSFLKHLQKTLRPDLRIIIMSATLETEALKNYLNDSTVLEVDGKPYPLAIEHLPETSKKPLEALVKDSIKHHFSKNCSGDALVFLPGKGEIRKAQQALELLPELKNILIVPLHGELDKDEQDLAIRPQKKRKIVLSTNLAETSLTIEGVNLVVDSGLERQASFSWWTGLPALTTRTISRASATQRAGRAARTGPGKCVRLFTKFDFESRPLFSIPEILRSDLSQLLLEMKMLGVDQAKTFSWLDAPSPEALKAAEELLFLLGATQSLEGSLTSLGRKMSAIPAVPRISKLLLSAMELNCFDEALKLGALISEQALTKLDALENLHGPVPFSVERLQSQWKKHFAAPKASANSSTHLTKALLQAFPDRIAKRRKDSKSERSKTQTVELVLSSGGSAEAPLNEVLLAHEYFMVLDVKETSRLSSPQSKTHARSVLGIDETELLELPSHILKEESEVIWDSQKKKALLKQGLKLGAFFMEETLAPAPSTPQNVAFFLKMVSGQTEDTVNTWNDFLDVLSFFGEKSRVESLLARCLLVIQEGQGTAISPSEAYQKICLNPWNELSVIAFQNTAWEDVLGELFLGQSSYLLQTLAPSHWKLPNGRNAPIFYPFNQNPWMESRLQDFFGLTKTPALLNGKVPLTLHLLAPNHRAIQVTQDLAGFWKNHYQNIKKELSRKYPRHAWPDDTSKPLPMPSPKGRARQ